MTDSDKKMGQIKAELSALSGETNIVLLWAGVHPRMKRSRVSDRLSNWLLAVTGAAAGLLIANYDKVSQLLGHRQLQMAMWLLLFSAVAGLVAKLLFTAADGSMEMITEAAGQNNVADKQLLERYSQFFAWLENQGVINEDVAGIRENLERMIERQRSSQASVAMAKRATQTLNQFLTVHHWCVPAQWALFVGFMLASMWRILFSSAG